LYDKIAAVFPLLVVRPEFHPHMTVGQWPKRELAATCSKLAAAWAAVRFECVDVVLLARRGNEPFRIVKRVSLAATDAAPAAAPAAAAAAAAAAASSTAVQPSAWSDMRGSIDPATSGFAESLSNALAEAAEEEAARRDPGLLFVTPPDSLPLSCHPTFERVRDWVIRSDANQLPKTRARLVQAMRPFLKATVDVDAAEMLALMQSEGYVEIKGEKQPVELPKKIADSKKQPLVPHAMLADANADIAAAQALAKSRCIAHLSAAGTKHRTQASLMASLKMLCRLQKPVDPQLIVDALIAAGLLEFVDPPPPNYARSQTRAPRHRDDEKRIHYF
jgi:hypothetical protein